MAHIAFGTKTWVQQQPHRILAHFPNVAYNVVAIAASLGGLKVIRTILRDLPVDFPAAIVIVQHLHPHSPSSMANILSQYTALQVKQAASGELLRPGTVYVGVPNLHLMVDANGRLSLNHGAKVNFVRPSADKLFQSVATNYKARAIAVILTGRGTDGLLGLLTSKKYGGIAIAQEPSSCECSEMPEAAIKTGKVDFVLSPPEIASTLVNLVNQAAVPALYPMGIAPGPAAEILLSDDKLPVL